MSEIYGPDSTPVCPFCKTVLPMEVVEETLIDGQGICRECETCGEEFQTTVMVKVEQI